MHPDNFEAVQMFSLCHGFKIFTGARYLVSFIRDDESKSDWLLDCMLKWENNIITISKTAEKYPQESYTIVVRTIQSEWIFLQRVTKNTVCAFADVKKLHWGNFLPCIFFGNINLSHPL